MGVELGDGAGFDGEVARVVDSACQLAQQEAVVFQEEHFNAEYALAFKGGYGFPCKLLGFDVDAAGDVPCWGINQLANGIFLDCLYRLE